MKIQTKFLAVLALTLMVAGCNTTPISTSETDLCIELEATSIKTVPSNKIEYGLWRSILNVTTNIYYEGGDYTKINCRQPDADIFVCDDGIRTTNIITSNKRWFFTMNYVEGGYGVNFLNPTMKPTTCPSN